MQDQIGILEAIRQIADEAELQLRAFSSAVFSAIPLPAGPYAIFHHFAHTQERLKDTRRILERMWQNREQLHQIDQKTEVGRIDEHTHGTPPSGRLQILSQEQRILTDYIKLDFEALYLFGTILLDQWSLMVAYSIGRQNPEEINFHRLVSLLEDQDYSGPLERLWVQQSEQMLWLNSHIRFYRNRFVAHSNRPWQRGFTRSLHGYDFRLFVPSPPGWENEEEISREINSLIQLAPQWLQDKPDDYWEKARPRALLERLLDNIGNVQNRADRDIINRLVSRTGISTPSFHTVGEKLLLFIRDATPILQEIAMSDIAQINVGRSENI